MTKYGWWKVDFTITLDGEEIYFNDLTEASQEHIADLIKDGCTQGEVVEEIDEENEDE